MKSICKNTAIAIGLAALLNTASASDLIGTAHQSPGGLVLEIGLANDGAETASGVQFDINLDSRMAASFENADLSSCLSGLPKTFAASSCTVIDDSTLRVVVLSMSGATVPSTILGTIKLPANSNQSLTAGASSSIQFDNVVMGDSAGNGIEPGLVDFSFQISAQHDNNGSKRQLIRPGN